MRGNHDAASGASSTPEPRHRLLHISTEEFNRRRFLRSKAFKHEEKTVYSSSLDKMFNCKVSILKLVLAIILIGAFFTLVHFPTIQNAEYVSDSLVRPNLIEDPLYVSLLDINWDKISIVIDKLTDKHHYRGIGLLNFNDSEVHEWKVLLPNVEHVNLHLDHVSNNITWETLYPEWIDEEEEFEFPTCPTLPMLHFPGKPRIDLIIVKLPCNKSGDWLRDVARLHLELATANLAASSKGSHPVSVLIITECFPTPNLFTCKDLVIREGNAWLYKPDLHILREKLRLPVGSCELSVPLNAKENWHSTKPRREAYATVLHSADVYVCGAITAAQSIRMTGSTRDLVILVDETISNYHKKGLKAAGWKIHTIARIRNPKAKPDAYNEWNYSKFRLWQLTDYDKIIFIDADLLILRNIDFLFEMPEISAAGNDETRFNSGVMVIEPSNCTFQLLMNHINEIKSYNGGDQGYLNEIFTWWHRIPKHMNFLKHFWVDDKPKERKKKEQLFTANPPELYIIHYLGLKPWLCFRDYDCNWNGNKGGLYASDVAHKRWWKVHDAMPKKLHKYCWISTSNKATREWDRREAEKGNYSDGHWKIKIKDPRLNFCFEKFCDWERMLEHWGENNWTDNAAPTPTLPGITTSSLSSL